VTRARELECEPFQDAAGNLFFRRSGSDSTAPVVTGSHIDTQPAGGRLDGAYGVCAGLEVMAALHDMGARTRHPIEVVVWANEEGCRFAPGSMGSAAFVDPARLRHFRDVRDARGVSYGECLDQMRAHLGDIPECLLERELHAFVELHIEQGPVLEQEHVPIGAVLGIQGVRWYRVRALGEAAHAGTTPLEHRRDALRALVDLANRMYTFAECNAGLRLTIGTLHVSPGSVNTVPGEAVLTLDVRHPEQVVLDACAAQLDDFCAGLRHGCEVDYSQSMSMPTTWFSDDVVASVRGAADDLGLVSMDMLSGAFHDSVHLARHCATGMIFVPSRAGLSHNPHEDTDSEHLFAGARVLANVISRHAGLEALDAASRHP
jgi:N-carbamoyl-L-amino-acid hydrolase